MVTRDRTQTHEDAHEPHEDRNRRGDAERDGGQMLFPEMTGHDGVDRSASHDRDVRDPDGAGQFGEGFEGGVGREKFRHKRQKRLFGTHDDEVFGRVGARGGFADYVGRVRQMVAQAKHSVAADLVFTGREGKVRTVGEDRADARRDALERNAVVRGDARRSDRRVNGGDDGR